MTRGIVATRDFASMGYGALPTTTRQCDPMSNYLSEFVGFVANAAVVCEGDPSLCGNGRQPFRVWTGRRKVVPMGFHQQARLSEYRWKRQAEIAVREEDNTQAARS